MRVNPSRLTLALSLAAAVTYSSWLLGPVLNPNLPAAHAFASELAATGQPYSWFFRTADLTTALLVGAVLALNWRHLRTRDLPTWVRFTPPIMMTLATIFVAATALDTAFPMPCAEALVDSTVAASPQCRTPAMLVHEFASVTVSLVTISACLLTVATIVTLYRRGLHILSTASVLTVSFASIHALSSTYTAAAALWFADSGLGVAQRISIASLCLWWLTLIHLLSHPRHPQSYT